MDSLLSSAECARALGITPASLRRRRMLGTSPPYIRLSQSKRARAGYRREDVERFLEEHRHTSTSSETVVQEKLADGGSR